MPYPSDIFFDAGDEVVLIRFPYHQKQYFHFLSSQNFQNLVKVVESTPTGGFLAATRLWSRHC
jgi:hypothetical protein